LSHGLLKLSLLQASRPTNNKSDTAMASAYATSANLSAATGQSMMGRTGTGCPGPGCKGEFIETILKYSKSLPVVELYETFMICGFGLFMLSIAMYHAFGSIASIYKTEGMTLAEASKIATTIQESFVAWIAVGCLILLIGVLLYYAHRYYM